MEPSSPRLESSLPLSALEFQILLVLAEGDLYGYAIMKSVEEASDGVLSPEIGSLYRVLSRLVDRSWVVEADAPPEDEGTHRGKPRKYYHLTHLGLEVAQAELRRLREVVRAAGELGTEAAG